MTLKKEHKLTVLDNRVLRAFRLRRDEVAGGWRKMHNEEFNLYSSPSKIRMTKSRRMQWAWHSARMGRRGMHVGYWWKARRKHATRRTKMLVGG
jgi:hypothetical protein